MKGGVYRMLTLLLYENFSPEKMNGFVMDAIHG